MYRGSDWWDKWFMDLAGFISTASKDPSTKVGAVLVDSQRRVVGHGYNGFARGVPDSPEDYANREVKYKKVVHAEINAVLNSNAATQGTTLYCTFFPCPQCAAMLIQAGIKRVVSRENAGDERWAEQRAVSQVMFIQAGIPASILKIDYNLED